MSDPPIISDFSHNKPDATAFVSDGLRDFFLYRDLGIKAATGGRVIALLVRANAAPEKGTGWHSRGRFPDRLHDEGLGPLHV